LYHDRRIFTARPEADQKKLRSRGGFQPACSLTHMNRHKQTDRKNQRKSPMKLVKKTTASQSAFFNPRMALGFVLCSLSVLLGLLGFTVNSTSSALAAVPDQGDNQPIVGASYKNDVSPALRDVAQGWPLQFKQQHEAA